MTRIVLDQATLVKLRHLREHLEVCDESGHTLGYVNPAIDPSLYQGVKPPLSEEELDRVEQDLRGRPLAEIWADLEKRG